LHQEEEATIAALSFHCVTGFYERVRHVLDYLRLHVDELEPALDVGALPGELLPFRSARRRHLSAIFRPVVAY
jgi:hypothetical protein